MLSPAKSVARFAGHHQYRPFLPVCSLERGANCSNVQRTQKSFERLLVTNRVWTNLSAMKTGQDNSNRSLRRFFAAANAPSRPEARAEHGAV
jgi:hypothetical protein